MKKCTYGDYCDCEFHASNEQCLMHPPNCSYIKEVNMYYSINIDDFCEEIFHELERIGDDSGNHRSIFKGDDIGDIAVIIAERLTPFIKKQLYESDDMGFPEEE